MKHDLDFAIIVAAGAFIFAIGIMCAIFGRV